MKKTLPTLLLSFAAVAAQAAGTDAELLRCLTLADTTARLACYDTLATSLRNTSAAPAATPAPAPAAADADFGRVSMPKPKAEDNKPSAMQSRIVGTLAEWRRGQSLTLANGQVWVINDEPANFKPLQDPAVTITPGILGSYFMKVEGISFQVKVKRVQ
ncbi:hypothetical protein SNE35_10805 [Paucibacter sp. R3-3]|uniref:Uncharacterized protein n=1 Tax=Roseateles agri TaxID=3098619 RepID=A0ABU5DFH2_9BURK|nr:hypothetical protein [Paucibacter sp. R3-3]MDY0745001.1 hypothetical protein [Paucibacter sp. R3-3]